MKNIKIQIEIKSSNNTFNAYLNKKYYNYKKNIHKLLNYKDKFVIIYLVIY